MTEEQAPKSSKEWLEAINLAGKAQEDWEEKGKKVVKRYRDERENNDAGKKFNILWSNVETLKPALYASRPVPNVTRRNKDKDPLGRMAAEILERALTVAIDYPGFDQAANAAVEDYLLPGRSVVKVDYKPTYGDEQIGIDGDTFKPVVYEETVCRYVFWCDVRFGYARQWSDVPWVAFRSYMTRKQLEDRWPEQGTEIKLDYTPKGVKEEAADKLKRAVIWEIWDKEHNQVLWITESDSMEILEEGPPPIEFQEFWPIPRPLFSLTTNDTLIPVPDYCQYQDQADELDELSQRIGLLVKALKVSGVYDASAEGIQQLISDGADNQLIPVDGWAAFAERGGVSGAIDWLPIEQIAKVLLGLYEAREKTKQELYEITGLSDIIRGASDARETAAAQKIKGRFASLRLEDRQKEIQRFLKDIIALKAEVIAEMFAPETLSMMTGQQVPEEVIRLLRDDAMRTFRIDIETDSTIAVDQQAEKESRIEFLRASSEFIAAALPLIEQKPDIAPLMGEMLMFGVRGFKAGRELEEAFEAAVESMSQKPEMSPEQQEEIRVVKELEIQDKVADIGKKKAETLKAISEAKKVHAETESQELENDATESGLVGLLNGQA